MDEEVVETFEDEYSDDSDYDDTEVIIGSKVNEDIHLLMKGYKKKKKNYKTSPALTKYERTRILAERATQINEGALALIANPEIFDKDIIRNHLLKQGFCGYGSVPHVEQAKYIQLTL